MSRTCQSRLGTTINLVGRRVDSKRNRQNVGVFLHLFIFYTNVKKYVIKVSLCIHTCTDKCWFQNVKRGHMRRDIT